MLTSNHIQYKKQNISVLFLLFPVAAVDVGTKFLNSFPLIFPLYLLNQMLMVIMLINFVYQLDWAMGSSDYLVKIILYVSMKVVFWDWHLCQWILHGQFILQSIIYNWPLDNEGVKGSSSPQSQKSIYNLYLALHTCEGHILGFLHILGFN